MHRIFRVRSGTSLVELLLFLAFFSLVSGVVVALLFSSNEQRVRQQTIALVDQTGIQLLQSITRRVRRAERIIDPPQGETGSLLFLQMAQDVENPTIIAQGSGVIMVVEANTVRPMTGSGNIVATNFLVRNTSPEDSRQSVTISFVLSRTIPLPTFPEFSRTFEALVTLFPDDKEEGDCGCSSPVCSGSGSYSWGYCESGSCSAVSVTLLCEP
ncbi:hypothetical protein A2454_01910 [Candidatus Peribacteria bacterium RIFOXYC2_FULL_55_14]|nr:MAG: hypothetical protein UY90_C0081G0005 [Candidatus Peregrinibacteria bacterium GW2011_GWA2_54_9]OGJ72428.1 MAG: hypothetical protein A2198_06540 [Candidatus Peribacteria bacterium RIFOXYA1_FULL_56_14]OGJ73477.1 MAG: hypothetical protein A2217_02095 [Candidatus Peribacteria bacterium RIFOXYA2_FULL_55_28]OGJ74658.1 MAG: hypothetical protein A2384_03380 [Candidatus Peribacteria bacterium RIFOXYB1_FULL_54_35]OGJ76823.1 MAG: hypothetical protein A2327_06870 [Candidatus Peribacteria bacterium R